MGAFSGAKLLQLLKTKVGMTVSAVSVTTVVAAAVVLSGNNGYRTISVEEVNGTTIVANSEETEE